MIEVSVILVGILNFIIKDGDLKYKIIYIVDLKGLMNKIKLRIYKFIVNKRKITYFKRITCILLY